MERKQKPRKKKSTARRDFKESLSGFSVGLKSWKAVHAGGRLLSWT